MQLAAIFLDRLRWVYQVQMPTGITDFVLRRSNNRCKTIPFYRLFRWLTTSFFILHGLRSIVAHG